MMIFFDAETTGLIKNKALMLVHQPHIIEIGAVRDDGEEFETLLNPGVKLEPIITKITGLRDEDLADAPTFRDVLPDLIEFFIGQEALVAHNMPFDLGMLLFELRRCDAEFKFPYPPNHIDTVQLAMPSYRGKFMKLENLYRDLIGEYEQKHRALEDAKDLKAVYHALMVRG